MSSPDRFWRRVHRCRKCGRVTRAFVRAPEREFGFVLVEDANRKPCAWERWQQRRKWLETRRGFTAARRRIAEAARPGRYARLFAAKRARAEAARLAALQGVLL